MIVRDVNNLDSPPKMRIQLITRATILKQLDDKHFKVAKKCYKLNHDKNIRLKLTYAPGDFVLVDRVPSTSSAAECLAAEDYSKLIPERHGPYRTRSVGAENLKIQQEGIEKFVIINCVTCVPQEREASDQLLPEAVEPETISRQPATKL